MNTLLENFNYMNGKEYTEEQITDIIVSALEGGIGYWACLDNSDDVLFPDSDDYCTSERVAQILFAGGSVNFFDTTKKYADADKWELFFDKLMTGFLQNEKERPWDCDLDNYDAVTADCIFQYAMFDKLVYS